MNLLIGVYLMRRVVVRIAELNSGILEQSWEGLRDEEHVFHPAFAHGGMSSGHVHVRTWRERLIPLVLARAKALQDYYESSPFFDRH